ncbi:hypothetical protein [Desulfobulbus alkaliphilus]|uniref:hypothetical protein n=1 Tax=Desulfobulbus alkaliphilus TaxID=869814 RepID=UPI0019652D86|nr:hypothetical protein [Desulfobulbus alkaliphilus]MBM9538774.1 hypothetical protein [Desulfobulbus alkaliphilus]
MPEKLDLETKKEIAKIGMTAALGITVVTAPFLKRNRLLKNLHTGAGVALAALGLWHHLLYQPETHKAKAATLVAKSNADPQAAALPEPTVDPTPAS